MSPLRLLPVLLIAPLMMVLVGCATHDDFDFETCGVRPRYSLPITFEQVPMVEAHIGGTRLRLILDTGSTGIVLTDAAVHAASLGTDGRRVLTSRGIGGTVRSFAGQLRGFTIGALEVPDHEIQVAPALAGADGLFGQSVLSVFEVDLDIRHRTATLYAGRLCPQTVVPPWSFPYSTLDAAGSESGRFLIPVTLQGRPITALLDTGAATTVVARDVATSLGITDAMLAAGPQSQLKGLGAATPIASLYRFSDLRIGEESYAAPLLVGPRADPHFDMILGSDFLAGHRVWLSYARKRVYIERGAGSAPRPGA